MCKLADESGVPRAAGRARFSYLNIPSLLAACEITGAEAVHPGYGFLSENARFAEILEDARHRLHRPQGRAHPHDGRQDRGQEDRRSPSASPACPARRARSPRTTRACASNAEIGFSGAGQGGVGRRRPRHEGGADRRRSDANALATARSEAKAAFGDDAVYLEKYLQKPRHIEIQVFGDGRGNAVHLGERDCSLQRRHQKIWEESPSPALNAADRARSAQPAPRPMRAR